MTIIVTGIVTSIVTSSVGFIVGWVLACIKIKKSAINTVRTTINDYIYRCDIGGYEHQFKFDNIFKEHLFVNGVYKGCQKVVQLVEDKD